MATRKIRINQDGFSLIELMVALAISSIVLAGIYAAYQDQLRTSITQERIVDMQQNLRVAMMIMQRDLRMGGANPTGDTQAGFITATANTLTIAMDDGGDGGTNNDAASDGVDNDDDGMIDESATNGSDDDGDGTIDEADEEEEWYDRDTDDQGEVVMYDLNSGNLRRWFNSAGSTNPTNARWIARNIDALNFVYFDGANPPNVIPTPITGNDLEDIRSVQVTVVARGGDIVPVLARKHTDRTIYRNPQGTVLLDMSAAPDQFRRQMVTVNIKCRNMGL